MKHLLNGPRREKTCLRGFTNNKGADQPAHLRRLISAFVIRFLESNISKLAPSKISIFYLVSVAEQTGLNLTLSETPKTGFLTTRPKWELIFQPMCTLTFSMRELSLDIGTCAWYLSLQVNNQMSPQIVFLCQLFLHTWQKKGFFPVCTHKIFLHIIGRFGYCKGGTS